MDSEPTGDNPSEAVGEPSHNHTFRAREADERAAALPDSEPGVLMVEDEMQGGIDIFTSDNHVRPLAKIEADVIRLAIGHYRGRMSEAARRLGIGRSTLYRKLAELGINPPS